jgi:rhodanese-related sulfurtransferase
MSGARFLLLILFFHSEIGCSQTDFDKKLNSLYKKTVPFISAADLSAKVRGDANVVLLDTRSKEEFAVSHLPNAIHLNYNSYKESQLATIPKNSIVVVYCTVGYRSERVGEQLLKLGFKNVYNLYGGIFQWKNEGRAVVSPSNNPTDSVHTYNKQWSKWLTNGVKVY